MGPDLEWSTLRDCIRRRPAMYLGDIDSRGLHHGLLGLVEISAAEFSLGGATAVDVTLQDGTVVIEDDGAGVSGEPVLELDGRSILEIVATTFLRNGQLRPNSSERSQADLPTAAALGETFRIESCYGGRRYDFSLCCGEPSGPVRDLGPTERRGTRFEWRPDPAIFRSTALDVPLIRDRLQVLSALRPGLRIGFDDGLAGRAEFFSPSGMADRLGFLIRGRPVAYREVFSVQCRQPGLALDVAFQHRPSDESEIETYANGERTMGDGVHWRGFQRGIISLLREKAEESPGARRARPDWASFERGLSAVLSVEAANLEFEAPTRFRLTGGQVEFAVEAAVRSQLDVWMSQHPSLLETLLERSSKPIDRRA